jgi:tRNA-dihydrouridine synthase B
MARLGNLAMKPFKIGNLEIASPLMLAPMVDVTDLPYREICRKAGAALAYTEMLYVDAILHENPKTLRLLKTRAGEGAVGLQITGSRVAEFEKLAAMKDFLAVYDKIDINCGCPSIRIAGKSKAGSYLLKHPEKIGDMIRALKKSGKPVTVKIRLGFDKINVLDVAKMAEEAGADAITVHARLAHEGGRVRAQWEWIKKVKDAVKIPVIGNGDIFSGDDAKRMMDETGCDGVMIARGAIGDPTIFTRVAEYLRTGKESEQDVKKNLELYLEYLELEEKYYGEDVDLGRARQIGGKFLKKFKHAAEEREKFHQTKTIEEMRDFIKGLLDSGDFSREN